MRIDDWKVLLEQEGYIEYGEWRLLNNSYIFLT
jgi:hypothetical protein